MEKLILGAALIAASASSFAAPTQNPSIICATAIPGIGYAARLSIFVGQGILVAASGTISVGQTKCVTVPKLNEGQSWLASVKVGGVRFYTSCDHAYTYHSSTSHGEAWYKIWGTALNPYCGRAG